MDNSLRLLISCLPKLNLKGRKDATQNVVNLQRQQMNSRLIASDYLEANLNLLDALLTRYGFTLRHNAPGVHSSSECFQLSTRALCKAKKTLPLRAFDWFFSEYNKKLLMSDNYITRRQAIKLLGDILLDRTNSAVMVQYVRAKDNLMILMNLLRESSKSIQIEAFHVFKLYFANQKKPPDIVDILIANQNKLRRLLSDLKYEKEDDQFEVDKAQVVREITALKSEDPL